MKLRLIEKLINIYNIYTQIYNQETYFRVNNIMSSDQEVVAK